MYGSDEDASPRSARSQVTPRDERFHTPRTLNTARSINSDDGDWRTPRGNGSIGTAVSDEEYGTPRLGGTPRQMMQNLHTPRQQQLLHQQQQHQQLQQQQHMYQIQLQQQQYQIQLQQQQLQQQYFAQLQHQHQQQIPGFVQTQQYQPNVVYVEVPIPHHPAQIQSNAMYSPVAHPSYHPAPQTQGHYYSTQDSGYFQPPLQQQHQQQPPNQAAGHLSSAHGSIGPRSDPTYESYGPRSDPNYDAADHYPKQKSALSESKWGDSKWDDTGGGDEYDEARALDDLVAAGLSEQDVEDVFSFARHSRADDIEDLLDRGLPVDVRDDFGNTLLTTASQNGNKRVAKLVMRRGANINARNHKGNTPLHYCYQYGYGETLGEYLISKGADPSSRNNAGKLPYDGV